MDIYKPPKPLQLGRLNQKKMDKEKLANLVNAYCESLGTTAVAINKNITGDVKNPFPCGIGRRAVYYASAPNPKHPISSGQCALFEVFFQQLEKNKNG